MSTFLLFIWFFIKIQTIKYVWQQTRWRASRCRAVRASTRRTRSRRLPRFGRSRLGRPLSSSLKRWFFHHHDCNQYYHHRDKTALFPCILLLFVTKTPCQEVVGYMQFLLTHNLIKISKMQNSSLMAIFVVVLSLECWSWRNKLQTWSHVKDIFTELQLFSVSAITPLKNV